MHQQKPAPCHPFYWSLLSIFQFITGTWPLRRSIAEAQYLLVWYGLMYTAWWIGCRLPPMYWLITTLSLWIVLDLDLFESCHLFASSPIKIRFYAVHATLSLNIWCVLTKTNRSKNMRPKILDKNLQISNPDSYSPHFLHPNVHS